jgi:hypothetical protein
MDGGLSMLVLGAVTGGSAYVTTRKRFARHPRSVLKQQRQVLEGNVRQAKADGATPDELKALQRDVKVQLDELGKVVDQQDWANKEMATVVGVASFAFPILGLITVAAVTNDKWLPRLKVPESNDDDAWPKLG